MSKSNRTIRHQKSIASFSETSSISSRASIYGNGTPTLDLRMLPYEPKSQTQQKRASLMSKKGMEKGNQHGPIPDHVIAKARKVTVWLFFCRMLTFVFPSFMLSCFGMKDKHVQDAWREKVTLCLFIVLFSGAVGFVLFGLNALICKPILPLFQDDIMNRFGPDTDSNSKYIVIRGKLYDIGEYMRFGYHRDSSGELLGFEGEELQRLEAQINSFIGKDFSAFFPPDIESSKCNQWPTFVQRELCPAQTNNRYLYCHVSPKAIADLSLLQTGNYLAFSWQNITQLEDQRLFVYNSKVYSLKEYMQKNYTHLGVENVDILKSFVGKDATRLIERSPSVQLILDCLEEQLLVGHLEGTSVGCTTSEGLVLVLTAVVILVLMTKFISAIAFSWLFAHRMDKNRKKPSDLNVIMFVTCYSEGRASIQSTMDSLANTDYEDGKKCLFVVCDGLITGKGNEKSTPDICLDLMERLTSANPPTNVYISLGDESQRTNRAVVYAGFYVTKTHRVPYLLVVKMGNSTETAGKPGNRGKRDSQLILMRFLCQVTVNGELNPLEYDLFCKLTWIMNFPPDLFDSVLMVDADTIVNPDSLQKMVNAMERDPKISGLCGETKIANPIKSLTTMIQVYEYFINHHLGKSFESIFGGVTCLPGCFSMYRIRSPKWDGFSVPILANPDIVKKYAQNNVETLHEKNLLHLGEDRYLTTLLLKTFPGRKTLFVPGATAKTAVPDSFRVLLSQRRRWINSTIHNLYELLFVTDLCGTFCFSMQFVVFMEFIATILMPALFGYFVYLIVEIARTANLTTSLIFTIVVNYLHALLIFTTRFRLQNIFWLIIYILSVPVWNFVLPVYSFWHFDDFSWGSTRKVKKGEESDAETADDESDDFVVYMTADEWEVSNKRSSRISFSSGSLSFTEEQRVSRRSRLSQATSE